MVATIYKYTIENNFLDVDEKLAEKEMIGCQVAMSSIVVMQRLKM